MPLHTALRSPPTCEVAAAELFKRLREFVSLCIVEGDDRQRFLGHRGAHAAPSERRRRLLRKLSRSPHTSLMYYRGVLRIPLVFSQ